MTETANTISCRGVWKIYGADPRGYFEQLQRAEQMPEADEIVRAGYVAAVRDASLEVAAEEMLVIMGLSGSGKSTLLRCLARLVEVTAGQVLVEERDIAALNESEIIKLRRNKMGMVFQNFALLPHRTVLENVAFPLEMRGQDAATRRARAMEVIELVGLDGREGYFPRELSGGQQQRVGIARSLAIEPDIWFLDEPFSALDPLIRREMQDEFLRLKKMLGKTIVFITHDFDEALRLADRIAIMKDGVICQIDKPSQIVLHPATDYVEKFTADVDKARVVRAGDIISPMPADAAVAEGEPYPAEETLRALGMRLINETRTMLPVADKNGKPVGVLDKKTALDILMNTGEV